MRLASMRDRARARQAEDVQARSNQSRESSLEAFLQRKCRVHNQTTDGNTFTRVIYRELKRDTPLRRQELINQDTGGKRYNIVTGQKATTTATSQERVRRNEAHPSLGYKVYAHE